MRKDLIERFLHMPVRVVLKDNKDGRGILLKNDDETYRLEHGEIPMGHFTDPDVDFIESLTRSRLNVDAGSCVVIGFEESDGEFEVHFDSYDHPKALVIKEIAGLRGNVRGEGNEILYHEAFGVDGTPYKHEIADLEVGDLFIWDQQPHYVHRLTGQIDDSGTSFAEAVFYMPEPGRLILVKEIQQTNWNSYCPVKLLRLNIGGQTYSKLEK